ncbi:MULTISPECIES: hypothetical protein [unclassified Microcoleus]|uniref:hypothetical protein n=1 Tax=unclassified Microcoleus TaxID=2642155 RepID=UPI002FD15194
MRLFAEFTSHLQKRIEDALSELAPLSPEEATGIAAQFPGIPQDYLDFLQLYGHGGLKLGEYRDTWIRQEPVLAASYFNEELYYVTSDFPAPRGDVIGFATDEVGALYGFDSGDGWRIVCVDGRRDVVRFELTFVEFIAGVVCCHPYMPVARISGGWVDGVGERFLDTEAVAR